MNRGNKARARGSRFSTISAFLMAAVATGPLLIAAPAQAQASAERQFDIPAQPLSDALVLFAAQSGYQVATDGAVIQGARTNGVRGTFVPASALSQLLSGTGFTFRINGNVVTLERAPQSADGAIQLGPVRVEGEGGSGAGASFAASPTSDPLATEGTGAYTPRATRAATRLPLTLRETPQSVTIVTSQQIEDRGIVSLAQAMETVTGVHVQTEMTRPSIFSRGLQVTNLQVDGSPMFGSASGLGSIQSDYMIAYDRIEVVRGPNGLLTGPGDPSGTITLVRKRPTREFQAHVSAGVGSWDNVFADADISGPLNAAGTVRGRVAAGAYDGNNFIKDTGRNGKALLATVEIDLTPKTTVRLGYHHDEYLIEGSSGGATVPLFYSDGTLYNAPRSMGSAPRASTTDQRARTFYLGLEHDFGSGWKFQGLVDYSRRDSTLGPGLWHLAAPSYSWEEEYFGPLYPDSSGTGTLASIAHFEYHERQWAYNFDFQGPLHLFGREHRLIFGATGWERRRDTMETVYDMSNPPPASLYETIPLSRATSWSYEIPNYVADHPESMAHTKQHGVFAAAQWNLTDSLKLITGARLTWWKTYTDRYNALTGELTLANSGAYKVQGEITPYVAATWDFHPNFSVYASYADIFQPQELYDSNDNLLKPVVGKNYEAGLKGEFLDGRLNASLAIFHIVQDNLGERDPNFPDPDYLTPGGNTPYRSVGKGITTEGVELEISGEPLPGWNISGGYTYAPSEDAEGEPYNTTLPKQLLRIFTTYRLPGAWSRLTLGIGANWNSAISQSMPRPIGEYQENGYPVTSQIDFRQGDVLRVNAMARYEFKPNLSLLLNVENLFDKKYYTGLATYGPALGWYGQPRRWRATVRFQY